jgi:hypothetical protein
MGRASDWKTFVYFMAIWNILWRFGIFYDHLVHFVFIWYIFSGFGISRKIWQPCFVPSQSPEKLASLKIFPLLILFFEAIIFF